MDRSKNPQSKTRERILQATISLLNECGSAHVTTNHIAQRVGISSGNLYFHFRNREEIVRALFDRMCESTYRMWWPKERLGKKPTIPPPGIFFERSMEVYWEFRFFHRDMYSLRSRDPALSLKWRRHWSKTVRLLEAMYREWALQGLVRPLHDRQTLRMIAEMILVASSAHFQFFESPTRPATRKPNRLATKQLATFLLPYFTERGKRDAFAGGVK